MSKRKVTLVHYFEFLNQVMQRKLHKKSNFFIRIEQYVKFQHHEWNLGYSKKPESKIQKKFNQLIKLSFDLSMFFHYQIACRRSLHIEPKSILEKRFLFDSFRLLSVRIYGIERRTENFIIVKINRDIKSFF